MRDQVDERLDTGSVVPVPEGVDVFISHVEEDSDSALLLADGLAESGYSSWCYERDAIPGPSYLLQTSQAVEHSRAVVVLVSPDALGSHQVTSEVVRAHESAKPFIPLLLGISHTEFGARQPEWREAIGSATTLEVTPGGVEAVLPRIVNGLRALGIEPGTSPPWPPPDLARVDQPTGKPGRTTPWLVIAAAVAAVLVAVAVVAVVAVVALRGEPVPTTTGGATPTEAVPSQAVPTEPVPTEAPGADETTGALDVEDSRNTPLSTSQAPARIRTASLARKNCAFGTCHTAPTNTRWLVLRIGAWNQGDLIYNEQLADEAAASYVTFGGQRADLFRSSLVDGPPAGMDVVYSALPPSLEDVEVLLYWPGNPPLRLHVSE